MTAIAQREIIRRQERVQRADAMAMEASARLQSGDAEGAVATYRRAMDQLP